MAASCDDTEEGRHGTSRRTHIRGRYVFIDSEARTLQRPFAAPLPTPILRAALVLSSDFKAVRLAPRIESAIGGIKADHGSDEPLIFQGEAQVVKVYRGFQSG